MLIHPVAGSRARPYGALLISRRRNQLNCYGKTRWLDLRTAQWYTPADSPLETRHEGVATLSSCRGSHRAF